MNKLVVTLAIVGTLYGCFDDHKAQMSSKVESPGVKVSERFGYDPVDSTRFLQAALDSGLKKIIIDRQAGPWYSNRLFGKSNQEIVVEEGAELKAKRGEFHGRGDMLLLFSCQSNIVLRGKGKITMWREDYDMQKDKGKNARGYEWSEWRHAVAFYSCKNVVIEDLSIGQCGGDCVYLGVTGPKNEDNVDIRMSRCTLFEGYRQGLSVISAVNLLIEDCVFKDTKGTPPEAGIDFEPNKPHELLKNIVVRNCQFERNHGSACEIVIVQYDRTSKPISFRFENCRSFGDMYGFRFVGQRKDHLVPIYDGKIEVDGFTLTDVRKDGIMINKKPFSSGNVVFNNVTLRNCQAAQPTHSDVVLNESGHEIYDADSITFKNLKVYQSAKREWLAKPNATVYHGAVTKISGDAEIIASDGSKTKVIMDEKWLKSRYPTVPGMKIEELPSVKLSGSVKPVDNAPGKMVALSKLPFRGTKGEYVFYAMAPGKISFKGVQRAIGKRGISNANIEFSRYRDAKVLAKVKMPGVKEEAFSFDAPEAGLYTLKVMDTNGNAFTLTSSEAPIAVDTISNMFEMIYPQGDFYIAVPQGKRFGVMGWGEGVENFSGKIFDPSGVMKFERENCMMTVFAYISPTSTTPGLWKFTMDKPKGGCLEDCKVKLTGIPGFLFLSKEKYWN